MGKSKSAGNGKLIIGILATLVVVFGAMLYLNSGQNDLSLGNVNNEDDNTGVNNQYQSDAFVTDNTGTASFAVTNDLSPSTKYIPTTVRVYRKETPNVLFDTATTIGTGTGVGTVSITKYKPGTTKPQEYIWYIAASDGVHTSATGTFTAEEAIKIPVKLQNQSGLLFKVKDNDIDGQVLTAGESTSNYTTHETGATFNSNGNADLGTTVGEGGNFDYTISISTNGTASTATQFEDKGLFVAINANLLADWDKPNTISIPGAVVTDVTDKMKSTYNKKIMSDGADWIYEITNPDGTPFHIGSSTVKMNLKMYSLSGVNPDDDIGVSFYTSGYFVNDDDEGMSLDTHSNDATHTVLYTPQTLTLAMS